MNLNRNQGYPMRLLINALSLLDEESGIGVYTRQIANACQKPEMDLTFFYGYPSRKLVAPAEGKSRSWLSKVKTLAKKMNIARKICIKALRSANAIANTIHPREWDCYFEPNFVFLPGIRAKRKILTVHDFSCFRYPHWHPPARVRYMNEFFPDSVEKADLIITPTNSIRKEALTLLGIDEKRIRAIHLGVDHAHFFPQSEAAVTAIRRKYNLPENFILHVGALEPRKNQVNLLAAHSLLPSRLRELYPLIIIGSQGWNNEKILTAIQTVGSHAHVIGYVPRKDLPALYSASTLFVYPSWYEGFGLPPLEAMACGCAVLTSTDPALMEISSAGALHAEAADPEDLASKMRQLLEDDKLRHSLEHNAPIKASFYTWSKSGEQHINAFQAES